MRPGRVRRAARELRPVSRYPKLKAILSPYLVGTVINNQQRAIVLGPLMSALKAHDPEDAFLLSMASDGQADFLITGDRRAGLLQRGACGRTRIVTPAAFCAEALG
jgi:predicted nucleic acid-binding protein